MPQTADIYAHLCMHVYRSIDTLGDVEADIAGDVVGGGGGDEGGVCLGGRQLLRGEGEGEPVIHSSHG